MSLAKSSNISLDHTACESKKQCIFLGLFPDGKPSGQFSSISSSDFERIGNQGYILHIDSNGVVISAKEITGLFYGCKTLSQIAMERTVLPGIHIRDWPTLEYRGIQQDIARGQIPAMETFERLTDVLAESKMNILSLYIENAFLFESHPDLAPSEALTPQQGRQLFEYAAKQHIDVPVVFQALGHSSHILTKPGYEHYSSGPCNTKACTITFDIRNPRTITLINELIDDVCKTFTAKYLKVDVQKTANLIG
jgi:N-acetyl-beta-hexosaminidase